MDPSLAISLSFPLVHPIMHDFNSRWSSLFLFLWVLSAVSLPRLTGQQLTSQQPGPTPTAEDYFHIQVIDQETGRGVPLVELKTVNGIRHWTDSAGNIAFNEADLMNQTVYFHVASHGYQYPKDGFGYRGVRLETVRGKKAVIKVKRTNLAERLYRITGTGIYRDTRLLGLPSPVNLPAINAQVLGSDSVVNALYRGKLYWFWGDTNRLKYPLGNFQVTGATSALPGAINPSKGFQLEYFQKQDGFTKSMAPIKGKGPTWIFGVFVTRDKLGNPKMIAKYEKVKPSMAAYQRGLVLFDDSSRVFQKLVEFELQAPLFPAGQSLVHPVNGQEYVFFATPFPFVRVRNDLEIIQDPRNYEAFTYFKPGIRVPRDEKGKLLVTSQMLERDSGNRLVTHWKKNAHPISPQLEVQLVQQNLIQRDEAITLLEDPTADQAKTQKWVRLSSGSVAWNAFRKKWIMVAVQAWGSSMLGEIWYAEAQQPEGPWETPTKIVSHNNYSFYNPRHHPYFDQEGGKEIFFEGTYTRTFSGTKSATPRYDYNQLMYKLDLSKIGSGKQ